MRNTIFIFFLLFTHVLNAQKRWVPKDMTKLEDADIYLEIGDYKTALSNYNELYEKYGATENLEFKMGLCHYLLDDPEKAEKYFIESRKNGNNEAMFYLGLIRHRQENFEEAMGLFQIYKNSDGRNEFSNEEVDRRIAMSIYAEERIAKPIQAVVYNMGEEVNTQYDDYGPLVTGNEEVMVFTSRREGSTGGKKDPYGEYLEDIYFTYRKDDWWSGTVNAGKPLNSSTHDAAVGLSAGGKSMIIYRTNEELTAGDLYLCHKEGENWTEPEMLDKAINSEYQEASATLTDDERTIYFSSNRPGGFGGKDIYRVVRIGADIWSLPLNLGPTINTEFDEDAPFLHPDGKTLYFSSKGHKNMGGYDVFKTSLKESYWSTPENLGYPVNTVRDDIFFVITEDGKRGYYSTDLPDGYGKHDIYAISFEDDLESLRIVKGKVFDRDGNALQAELTLFDQEGEIRGIYKTNSATGNYIIILPPDEDLSLFINSEGFEEKEEPLYYRGGTIEKERILNIDLRKSSAQ